MNKTKPVSFRLDPIARVQIDKKAQDRGVRVSEYARSVILADLNEESELALMRMKLSSLEAELKSEFNAQFKSLREDFSVAVKALLVTNSTGEKITAEDADKWVEMNLNTS